MSEVLISQYPFVSSEAEETYVPATTFSGVDLIIFNKIPEEERERIERIILQILEHETLHIVLHRIGESDAGHSLDLILPFNHSLGVLKRRLIG